MRKKLFLMLVLLLFPVVALADRVSIDGTEYTTQETAFAALTEGKTLKFEENSTDMWTFEGKTNVTIDLNGKNVKTINLYDDTNITLTNSGTTSTVESIYVGLESKPTTAKSIEKVTVGTLVVSNGSTATMSDVIVTGFQNWGTATVDSGTFSDGVENNGKLTFNNGTVTSDGFVFRNREELIINDGTFKATDDEGAFVVNWPTGDSKGITTVNGGTFTGKSTIFSAINGTINVNGGTFTTTDDFSPLSITSATFNFNAGTITAKKASTIAAVTVGGEFNFGKKSSTPDKSTPILNTPKAKMFVLASNFHFYGGTMYLAEAIETDVYKSEVKLYDIVYEKQSDGSYKAYLKKATVQEDALWTKFKKAFKNNDVLTAMKKVSNYTVTITDNGDSISYTIKDKAMNHTRTVKFSYANGIVSLSNPIKAGEEANKNDMLDSIADTNAISNAVKALADVKGYKYEDLLAFIIVNGNDLKIAKDGAEFKYSPVSYDGSDLTDAEKKVLGSNPGDYDVTSVFKIDLKNGVKSFNGSGAADAKYTCKRVDGLFYDKDGNVVSKAEYEKACPEKVPDTGFIIPSIIVGILSIGFVAYKKFNFKNKLTRI